MDRIPNMVIFVHSHLRMSWKIALTVALLTGIITAMVTAPVADKVTRMHGVSDFEGARGMAIGFLFIPAAFIGGLLLGLLGTKLVHATEWVHFWKAAGLSILMGQVALFGVSGLSLLSIPRPPLMDGHQLELEIEVLVPMTRITPESRRKDGMRVSLYAGEKDNHYADMDTSQYRQEGDTFIVPAVASLNSTALERSIGFTLGTEVWLSFDASLPPAPGEKDLTWTEPKPMHDARTAVSDRTYSDVRVRYRVVKRKQAE